MSWPEAIGRIDVALLAGGSQDDDEQRFQSRLLPDPFQSLQTSFNRELQVQQDENRQRKLSPISVLANAVQIIDGLLSILRHVEGVGYLFCDEDVFEKINVVFLIFNQQQRATIHKI